MTDLEDLLPASEGSDIIRKCWGDIPPFKWGGEVLHLIGSDWGTDKQKLVVTALFHTNESDDWNKCKPSKIEIEISGVSLFEYDNGCREANGIQLNEAFHSPSSGTIALNIGHAFYLVCRGIRILSCVYDPYTPPP